MFRAGAGPDCESDGAWPPVVQEGPQLHPVCPICTDTEPADLDPLAGLRQPHTCPRCGTQFAFGDGGPEIVAGPDPGRPT